MKGGINMPIKDTFPHEYRWDSVGLDCGVCKYMIKPVTWPDRKRVSCCRYHKISLKNILNEEGYIDGEYFCKNFKNNGGAYSPALKHFKKSIGNRGKKCQHNLPQCI